MAQVLRSVSSVMVVPLMVPPNPQAVVTPAELAASALPMMPPVLTFAGGIRSP